MGTVSTFGNNDLSWRVDLSGLRGLARLVARQHYRKALSIAKSSAEEVTEWMRQHAPWEDQTGNARASLECVVVERASGDGFDFIVKGGGEEAPYMVLLEFDHAGRFSIVGPTLEYWGPTLWDRVQEALGRGLVR